MSLPHPHRPCCLSSKLLLICRQILDLHDEIRSPLCSPHFGPPSPLAPHPIFPLPPQTIRILSPITELSAPERRPFRLPTFPTPRVRVNGYSVRILDPENHSSHHRPPPQTVTGSNSANSHIVSSAANSGPDHSTVANHSSSSSTPLTIAPSHTNLSPLHPTSPFHAAPDTSSTRPATPTTEPQQLQPTQAPVTAFVSHSSPTTSSLIASLPHPQSSTTGNGSADPAPGPTPAAQLSSAPSVSSPTVSPQTPANPRPTQSLSDDPPTPANNYQADLFRGALLSMLGWRPPPERLRGRRKVAWAAGDKYVELWDLLNDRSRPQQAVKREVARLFGAMSNDEVIFCFDLGFHKRDPRREYLVAEMQRRGLSLKSKFKWGRMR